MANADKGAEVLDASAKANNIIPLPQVKGAELFDEVESYIGRFISYPSENERIAHALWIGHCHLIDLFDSTPRLAFLSPEPGSGKTRALEVTEFLVPRPIPQFSCSASSLYRTIASADKLPTVLFDEIDAVFGNRAPENEDLRALLNSGHRRGAVARRCGGPRMTEVQEFPSFCPVALAGLGNLPSTIFTRSVIIRMKKRAPSEVIESFRERIQKPSATALRDQLETWAGQFRHLSEYPEMPTGIEDRDADVWEPLLIVADFAGGDWPKRARDAAVALVKASKESPTSLGVKLLADLKDEVFKDRDELTTVEILQRLCDLDESPWKTYYKGNPLDARGLAKLLQPYGVSPRLIRPDGIKVLRGYNKTSFLDTWPRYLPAVGAVASVASVANGGNGHDPMTDATYATAGTQGEFEIVLHDFHLRAYLASREIVV